MAQTQTPSKRRQTEGERIDYTPGSQVYSGDIVLINGVPTLADLDIAVAEKGSISNHGVWQCPKVTGAVAMFDPIYWNPTANPVIGTAGSGAMTTAAAGGYFAGLAAKAQLSGDSTVEVIPVFGQRSVAPSTTITTVAATGTIQGDAAPLAAGFNNVTGADGTKGVALPDLPAGSVVEVKNNANAALKVWPFLGDGINAVAVNSAYSMAAFTSAKFTKIDGTSWVTTPLVAS